MKPLKRLATRFVILVDQDDKAFIILVFNHKAAAVEDEDEDDDEKEDSLQPEDGDVEVEDEDENQDEDDDVPDEDEDEKQPAEGPSTSSTSHQIAQATFLKKLSQDLNTSMDTPIDAEDIIRYISDSPVPQRQCVVGCLLYTSPSPRDATLSRMPSSA